MNIDKETLCLLVGCLDNLEHELLRLFHGSQHDPAFLQLSSCSTRESTIRNLTLGESCRRLAYLTVLRLTYNVQPVEIKNIHSIQTVLRVFLRNYYISSTFLL